MLKTDKKGLKCGESVPILSIYNNCRVVGCLLLSIKVLAAAITLYSWSAVGIPDRANERLESRVVVFIGRVKSPNRRERIICVFFFWQDLSQNITVKRESHFFYFFCVQLLFHTKPREHHPNPIIQYTDTERALQQKWLQH